MSLALVESFNANTPLVQAGSEPSVTVLAHDAQIRSRLTAFFSGRGLQVAEAASSDELASLERVEGQADAVIVVARQPDRRLAELVRSLRARGSRTAFILLSDVDDVVERVLAIELGFDDIVAEACSPREILARIHRLVQLRTSSGRSIAADQPDPGPPAKEVWLLDVRHRTLSGPDGRPIALSPQNFAVLNHLVDMADPNSPIDATERAASALTRTAVSRLRKRFRSAGSKAPPLLTVRGGHYSLCAEIRRVGLT
jgi:DNA-binding response OmpR family regulator